MSFVIENDPAPLKLDADGDVRVGGTRVLLDLVVYAFNQGATPEEIVLQYQTLPLADVYAVLAYYLRHRQAVDAYLHWREQQGEELRQKIQADQDVRGIRERLLARRAKNGDNHAPSGQ